ncbi:MAG: HDIG domain-containing protein [Candidatus Cloacimonetes bacterium]|nr:HDIG domain-containing protein [Candidatus Cloacimonadota bacterium]
MNKKIIPYIIATAFIISVFHYFFSPYKFVPYSYNLKIGQIAEKDIIALFDFPVYKSAAALSAEQETSAAKVIDVYRVSDNLKFNALKNLDFIIQHFVNASKYNQKQDIADNLLKDGFALSDDIIKFLEKDTKRQQIYDYLVKELDFIFDIGIYPNSYTDTTIRLSKGETIKKYPLSRLFSLEEAKLKLFESMKNDIEQKCLKELANIILIENIIIDQEVTKIEKQRAREQVAPTIGKVLKNEKIISKNQKVTATEAQKLTSLIKAQNESKQSKDDNEILLSSIGILLLSFVLLFLFYKLIALFFPENFLTIPRLVVILCSFLATIILTIFVNNILVIPSILIPFSFTVIAISLIFNPHLGLIYNFFNLIFVTQFLNWNIIDPSILSISTIGGIIALKKMQKKVEYYPMVIYLFFAFLIVSSAIALIKFDSLNIFLYRSLYGVISISVSIILVVVTVPIVERKLNLATKQILLELLDFDNPLLQRMSKLAPGTYHHSLIVGNLSETAAEAIGANHLLARVGSYYHDIGKIEKPEIFIENNSNASELHDIMMANESAKWIKDHITAGIKLATKHRLPKQVMDIIRQHHGKDQIRYFYNKAKETNLEFNEEEFYYEGPKPQTKEAAIVMIADIIESTTKSLNDLDEKIIIKVFDDTINRLINVGQLDDAPLTMKELDTIKHYMHPIIMGVYRRRLEYPDS